MTNAARLMRRVDDQCLIGLLRAFPEDSEPAKFALRVGARAVLGSDGWEPDTEN